MEQLTQLMKDCRSYRRFNEKRQITEAELEELAGLARYAGSARNAQPLRFLLVTSTEYRDRLFPLLGWAGYLTDWKGPEPGERPTAYIVCLADRGITGDPAFDLGIASQNILLAATARGLGGCRIASFSRAKVQELFGLAENLDPILVIALGEPAEEVVIERSSDPSDIKYWRDESGVHHVPKLGLEDLIGGRF